MIKISRVHSELTNRLEDATICPELRSEFDRYGRPIRQDGSVPLPLIVEGVADIDLLAMHDFCYDSEGRIMPVELATCDRNNRHELVVLEPGTKEIPEQARDKILAAAAGRIEKNRHRGEKKKRLLAHRDRIRQEEWRWQHTPTDEEVEEMVESEPDLINGIAKLMILCLDKPE